MELVLHVFLHFRRAGYTLSCQIIVDQVASFPWTTIPYFFFKECFFKTYFATDDKMVHFLKKFLSNVQQKQYITCGKIEREGQIFYNKSRKANNKWLRVLIS